MKSARLRDANIVLSTCGRIAPPQHGMASVEIPASFLYQTVVPTAQTQQQPLEISGEQASWFLSSISGMQPPSGLDVFVQFVFPNGRNLQQNLRDWTQDAGIGSSRYVLDREVECPPGSKIRITGSTVWANPQTTCAFSVLFEGVYRFHLEGPAPGQILTEADLVADLPRVFKTRNQNLLVPRWMTGMFPAKGGQKYFYCSTAATFALPAAVAGANNFIEVTTDSGFEFDMLRRFIRVSIDAGSAGTPYIRSRLSNGEMLDDDYVSVAGVTGQFLGKYWHVPPGKSIITDIAVMDASGTGNLNIQMFFEGIRRQAHA